MRAYVYPRVPAIMLKCCCWPVRWSNVAEEFDQLVRYYNYAYYRRLNK